MSELKRKLGIDRRQLLGAAGAAFVLSQVSQAYAGYPSHPVTIICPYAAGATTDILSRIMAQSLPGEIGGNAIVENRPGAGGNIGTAAVALAEPDGYTLLLGAMGPLAINGALYAKTGFDPLKDFAPLGLFASVPLALVVNPNLGVNSLDELVQRIRKDEVGMNFASAGAGTPMHLAGELFARQIKGKLTHIAYRGSAPAINDVLAGHVPFMFDALANVIQHIKAGTLKALATTAGGARPSLLDDVPTLKEAGYDVVVSGWYGFLVPVKTPEPIRDELVAALARISVREDVRKKLAELGSDPVDPKPEAFRNLIQSEIAKWQPLIRELGLKME